MKFNMNPPKIKLAQTGIGLQSCYIGWQEGFASFYLPGTEPIFRTDAPGKALFSLDISEMRSVRDFLNDTIERMEAGND